MRLSIVLVACFAVAAFGCTREEGTNPPRTASHVASSTSERTVATFTPRGETKDRAAAEPRSVAVDPRAHGPVSLTGNLPYAERFDPSGWSGRSTPPEGIGGGPPSATTTDTTDTDNPYEDADEPSSEPESPPADEAPPPAQ